MFRSVHISGFDNCKFSTCCHKSYCITCFYRTFLYSHIYYNSLVCVIIAVEYKSLKRSIVISLWCRNISYYPFKDFFNIYAHFSGYSRSVHSRYAYNVLNLGTYSFRVGRRQIYLVYYRNYLKVMFDCKICVCKSLSLYSLRGINDKYSSLTGGK